MKLVQKITTGYIRAHLNILAMVSKKKAAKKAFHLFCTPMVRSKKKQPEIFEMSEQLSVYVDGIAVHGNCWRPVHQEAGRHMLILHGFESRTWNFEKYISLFLQKGYVVYAFDAPAHGNSGGKELNLPLYIKTIRVIHETFGPMQAYLAHSFGGLAITHYLETVPDTKNLRLGLIAPAVETTTAIDQFFDFLQLNSNIREEFDAFITRRSGHEPAYFSLRRSVRNIESEILWIHDRDDKIIPMEDVQREQDDKPAKIQFVITEGLGHRRIYRDEKVIKMMVDFL